ncbi:MAG TPA: hypothetical protein ENI32_02430 [Candidatus Syntrophoarchaeum butanivorans]|uniref:Uncharacterized protein n=1 Tax=Candidatus Syntropharchaeum butanivorans TaxID=1839936 RepID=A0A1F2P3N0_9EURY|nr:MAG: hypothetical protein SBU_001296 [Candidatus Syntrophoarchaeum butanivorans]HEC56730.1 hypothetical protein [Candidatus Syntrophoarchaeum butanivorans]
MNYKLWEHGVDLDTGKEYVNEVKKILLSLKNSLEEDLEEGMQNKDSGMYQSFSEITQGIFSFAYRKLKGVDMPGITTGWRGG